MTDLLSQRKFRPTLEDKKIILHEVPCQHECQLVWQHKQVHPVRVPFLMRYCEDALDSENGLVKIEYEKEKFGRYWIKENKGCKQYRSSATTMGSEPRANLFEKTECDIDVVNCHPNLIRQANEQYKFFDLPAVDYYCENRLKIFADCWIDEEAIKEYNKENFKSKTKYDLLKVASTMLLFGARIKKDGKDIRIPKWEQTFNLDVRDFIFSKELLEYFNEIQQVLLVFPQQSVFREIADFVKEKERKKASNKYVSQEDWDAYSKKGGEPPSWIKGVWKEKDFRVSNGKILGVILQDLESQVILEAMKDFYDNGFYPTCYSYDGFQILKDDRVDDMLVNINKKWKYVDFIVKPFKKPLDTTGILPETNFSRSRFALYRKPHNLCYKAKKRYFEKYHFKTVNPVAYYRVHEFNHVMYNRKNFADACANLKSMEWNSHLRGYTECKFFNQWEVDENMLQYDRALYYPPPLKAPSNHFNLWRGYPILKTELDMSADTSVIYKHVQFVANHNRQTYEWILNYYAKILQFPATKSECCPIFMGKQGTGKSLIAERIIKNIVGEDMMLIVSDPQKFAGRFSDITGKLLIVLNEACGESNFNITETLKDRITATSFAREKKGIDIEGNVPCFDNYNFTTNHINSFQVPTDDRRTMPIEVDDSIAQDKRYFVPVYTAFDDKKVMRKFAEELLTRDVKDIDIHASRPMTELRGDMMNLNLNCYKLFMMWIKQEFDKSKELYEKGIKYHNMDNDHMRAWNFKDGNKPYEYTRDELYNRFCEFWSQEKGSTEKSEEKKPAPNKFATNIKKMNGVMKKRVGSGHKYSFEYEEFNKEVEKLILLQDGNACVKQDMPIPSKYGVYEMPPPYVVPDEHKTVSIYDCENWLEVLEKEEER